MLKVQEMRLDLLKVKKNNNLLLKKWFKKLFKNTRKKKQFNFSWTQRLSNKRFLLKHTRKLKRKPISRSTNKKLNLPLRKLEQNSKLKKIKNQKEEI